MPQQVPAFAVRSIATSARRPAAAFQRGQGMTEYIIIVALIAVAAIGVYQFFGQVVRSQTAAISHEIAGKDGAASITDAGKAADSTDAERKAKGLANYSGGATEAAAGK